jgi:hypothetical protein
MTVRGGWVEPTRVMLKMPRMLCEIVQELLEAQADIEVVAVLDGPEPLQDAVIRFAADLVIIAGDQLRVPPAWLDLLATHPRLNLFAVAQQGQRTALCQVIGDVAPQQLVEAVRSARSSA